MYRLGYITLPIKVWYFVIRMFFQGINSSSGWNSVPHKWPALSEGSSLIRIHQPSPLQTARQRSLWCKCLKTFLTLVSLFAFSLCSEILCLQNTHLKYQRNDVLNYNAVLKEFHVWNDHKRQYMEILAVVSLVATGEINVWN